MPARMTICDMNRNKICELYDSELQHEGQAYDVTLTTEISGWKECTPNTGQSVLGVFI